MRTRWAVTTILVFSVLTPLAITADEPAMVVRDANGKLVGTVLAQTAELAATQGLTDRFPLWVARKIPGSWIFLPVTKGAVRTTKDLTPFLYENDTCTGPPLLDAPRTDDEVRATVLFDTQVYWSEGAGSERIIRSRGFLTANPEQCNGTVYDGNLCCTMNSKAETRFAAETTSAYV